jgi:hypothetical protein
MPSGIASGVGFAGAIAATIVAVALHSTHHPLLALIPLGLVIAVVASLTSWAGGLATAWICWFLDSGFVIGRAAQLTFAPAAQLAALVLVSLALVAGLGGRAYRRHRPKAGPRCDVQPIQSWKERPETLS